MSIGRPATDLAWLGYFTSMIASTYAVFADRAASARTPGTKQERIREHILRHAPATFRLADIRTAVPGVSDQTIRLVLEHLRGEGKVRADGTGRSATWTRTPNTAPSDPLKLKGFVSDAITSGAANEVRANMLLCAPRSTCPRL